MSQSLKVFPALSSSLNGLLYDLPALIEHGHLSCGAAWGPSGAANRLHGLCSKDPPKSLE